MIDRFTVRGNVRGDSAGAATGASPEWTVPAIGAGVWLVKSYLGTGTSDRFRTWSVLERVISITGLFLVMLASGWF